MDQGDANHPAAARWFSSLDLDPGNSLITHNYVIVETTALIQNRLGRKAARKFLEVLLGKAAVHFVDETTHNLAATAFLAGGSSNSLVDRTSFEIMKKLGLRQAFAFDADFRREGFVTIP